MSGKEHSGRIVFKGRRIELRLVDVSLAGGGTAERELVMHPGAVVILPIGPDGRVVLIRNQRYTVGEDLWELPAGTLEPPESPAACALRELEEEAGYRAGTMTPLGQFYSTPGFCNEKLHAFVATDLVPCGQQLEPDENIRVELVPLATAKQMMQSGQIHDGKTLATLGLYLLGRDG
jgi:ADP-ribose pyrophosphatase